MLVTVSLIDCFLRQREGGERGETEERERDTHTHTHSLSLSPSHTLIHSPASFKPVFVARPGKRPAHYPKPSEGHITVNLPPFATHFASHSRSREFENRALQLRHGC